MSRNRNGFQCEDNNNNNNIISVQYNGGLLPDIILLTQTLRFDPT